MTKWPQLTPKDVRDMTPACASRLLKPPETVSFKTMAEYRAWQAQQQKQ
jgi:hypothetical protein